MLIAFKYYQIIKYKPRLWGPICPKYMKQYYNEASQYKAESLITEHWHKYQCRAYIIVTLMLALTTPTA